MKPTDLRGILHYVPQFRDRVFLIAIDGSVVADENFGNLLLDIAVLRSLNIRIVLVQNIGLVTVAALIGGGGFGTYVFQGIGQTAIDLVLLGAIPTVALAFSAAVLLDALVDVTARTPQ